ncbi:MAG: FAD-dependent oxidoreductase [Armatimonadetes bacterium]|nr:FAD-dependent oxidoreductase [Armatimonadota bacterium]
MEEFGDDLGIPLRHIVSCSSRTIKTGYQRFERPVYDHAGKYAPCRAGCPAGQDIAWAASLAARGRLDLALEALRDENPFPAITGRVCYAPCERACNRAEYDQPIAINALERAYGEHGNGHPVSPAPRRHRESIGIVGAGPAGLTCAYHLARFGYAVTVYDAHERPGGMLAYAIPAYRLPREVVAAEVAGLHAMGIAFRCGVRVGTHLSFEDLRRAHDALFLATGLGRARMPSIPLPADGRVQPGLDFLRAVSTGTARPLYGHVAVLGGGDVAVDAARTALRLGADAVTLCCPETRATMPAHPPEVEAARAEGVEVVERVAPADLAANGGPLRLALAPVQRMRRAADGSVRFDTGGQQRLLFVSHLVYAVGQEADLSFLPSPLADRRGLRADVWGRTAVAGVFAGGDVTGAGSVVNAVAAGKRAAIAMDCLLRGRSLAGIEEQISVGHEGALSMAAYEALRRGEPDPPRARPVRSHQINLDYFPPADRARVRELEPDARARSFAEAAPPLSPEAAQSEAARCFHCGACNMCGNCFIYCPDSSVLQLEDWGFAIDLDHCKGCGVCVEECPRSAMSMVPEWEVARELAAR